MSADGGNAGIKRRRFLDLLLGIGFVSTAVSFLYPLWRYLIPPAAAEATTNTVVAGNFGAGAGSKHLTLSCLYDEANDQIWFSGAS